MDKYEESYENLRIAIVKQAADDYRRALKTLRRRPKDVNALHMKEECERFFGGQIEKYSNMDGEMLMRGIQNKIEQEQ